MPTEIAPAIATALMPAEDVLVVRAIGSLERDPAFTTSKELAQFGFESIFEDVGDATFDEPSAVLVTCGSRGVKAEGVDGLLCATKYAAALSVLEKWSFLLHAIQSVRLADGLMSGHRRLQWR